MHDPETFRQAIDVGVKARRRADGVVIVTATVTNVGAGHYYDQRWPLATP